MDIQLIALTSDDREQFILDNQEAFNFGALEEFGRRDDHFEEGEEIISRKTVGRFRSLPLQLNLIVGARVLKIDITRRIAHTSSSARLVGILSVFTTVAKETDVVAMSTHRHIFINKRGTNRNQAMNEAYAEYIRNGGKLSKNKWMKEKIKESVE